MSGSDNKKPNIIREKSYAFAVGIIKLYQKVSGDNKEYVLSRQLLKSGTSIGANVREAINAESGPDFIHKLAIAQKECDETLYWLELMKETGYIVENQYSKLYNKAHELLKIIRSIILSSKSNS